MVVKLAASSAASGGPHWRGWGAETKPTLASCADAHGDDTGRLTRLVFALSDPRAGEHVDATVVPVDAKVTEPGLHSATIRLSGGRPGGITARVTLRVQRRSG